MARKYLMEGWKLDRMAIPGRWSWFGGERKKEEKGKRKG